MTKSNSQNPLAAIQEEEKISQELIGKKSKELKEKIVQKEIYWQKQLTSAEENLAKDIEKILTETKQKIQELIVDEKKSLKKAREKLEKIDQRKISQAAELIINNIAN